MAGREQGGPPASRDGYLVPNLLRTNSFSPNKDACMRFNSKLRLSWWPFRRRRV
jgi:hypothetical protein